MGICKCVYETENPVMDGELLLLDREMETFGDFVC